jgi:iron(III) transport system ATP-binding protein
MNTVVKMEGVSFIRPNRLVLDSINLELQTGETLAVLGPSGGGKTTLLRLIAGLDAPSSGSIEVGGRRASESGRIVIAPEHRGVSFVFQDLALWSHMTVAEHLDFALTPQHLSKEVRRTRIESMLNAVDLTPCTKRRPGELSGGERQRVAIARALVTEPKLVLFDEPLANLDIALKQQLLALFSHLLRERGIAALYVTHDPIEAVALTERLAILEDTRLTSFNPASQARFSVLTPFAAAINRALSSPRTNANV